MARLVQRHEAWIDLATVRSPVATPGKRGEMSPRQMLLLRSAAPLLQSSASHAVFGIGKPKNREEHRYYLLPGMGKANRRKRALYLRWAIVAGVFISLIIGIAIYLVQRPGPGFLW